MENNQYNYMLQGALEEIDILPLDEIGPSVNTFMLGATKNFAYDNNGKLKEVTGNNGVDYSSFFEMEERANTLFNHPDNDRTINPYEEVFMPQRRYKSQIKDLTREHRQQAREAKIQNRYNFSQREEKPNKERISYINKPNNSSKLGYLNLPKDSNNQNEIVMKPKKEEKNYEEIANVFYPNMPEVSQIKARAKKIMPLNSLVGYVAPIEFYANYKDMEDAKTKLSDKYFHAKANCESAQKGDIVGAMTLSILKEIYDVPKKIIFEKKQFKDTLNDSFGDIRADVDGVYLGISNPMKNCQYLVDKYRPNGLDSKY